MRKSIILVVGSVMFVFGMAQAAPPAVQAPADTRSQQASPGQPRPDHQRFKQAQKPQALGREGRVSMEPDDDKEEEEALQNRPNPMSGQSGRQPARMNTPAGSAQQIQGR